MVHTALEVQKRIKEEGEDVGVIDLYRIKPIEPKFEEELFNYDGLVSLEEHLLDGGLGSLVSEIIMDSDKWGMDLRLKRIGLNDYIYAYGGRKNIQQICKIDADSVHRTILEYYGFG